MDKVKSKDNQLFKEDTEIILVKGLDAMTKACDALTRQNERNLKDIEGLKKKIERLQHRVLINQDEKE